MNSGISCLTSAVFYQGEVAAFRPETGTVMMPVMTGQFEASTAWNGSSFRAVRVSLQHGRFSGFVKLPLPYEYNSTRASLFYPKQSPSRFLQYLIINLSDDRLPISYIKLS
jgi:hypothetical protein